MTHSDTMNIKKDANIDILVEIAGWASGYQIGSDAETCMKHIVAAMQREGYLPKGKRRIIK